MSKRRHVKKERKADDEPEKRRGGNRVLQRVFLQAFKEHMTIYGTCQATGIDNSTVHNWLRYDPAFKEKFELADEQATDALETATYRDAIKGDSILKMFLLKARRPAKYREKGSFELTGKDGKPLIPPQQSVSLNVILPILLQLKPDELKKLAQSEPRPAIEAPGPGGDEPAGEAG